MQTGGNLQRTNGAGCRSLAAMRKSAQPAGGRATFCTVVIAGLTLLCGHGATPVLSFADGLSFAANTRPVYVSSADLDGDGRPDIAVANMTAGGGVSILQNLSTPGQIALAAPLFYSVSAGTIKVRFADLDGDTRPEIVAVREGGVFIFRNTGSPGTISFGPQIVLGFGSPSLPNGATLQDFDGDGRLDLAFLNSGDSRLYVWRNESSPGELTSASFTLAAQQTQSSPVDIVGGDFNGDGKPDLITASSLALPLFINTSVPGAISLQRLSHNLSLRFFQPGVADCLWPGDIDGDGELDLMSRSDSTVTLHRNDRTQLQVAFSSSRLPGTWTAMGLGDVTHDGKPEVLTVHRTARQIAVFSNRTSPGVLNSNLMPVEVLIYPSNNPVAIMAVDVDGDQAKDLVTCSTDGANVVTVYRNLLPFNRPPRADAGADQTIECTGGLSAITLDGTGSSDPDADALAYFWWNGTALLGSGAVLNTNLPTGTHVIRLTVVDPSGASAEDTVVIRVRDTKTPQITKLKASPHVLWPPNRRMIPVTVKVKLVDECDGQPAAKIISVESNEPEHGKQHDWEITGPLTVNLRAEHGKRGRSRIYLVNVEATDAAGNKSTNSVSVKVPKSQSHDH